MEQILDTAQKDFFSTLVNQPELIGAGHVDQLTALVNQYPHSGILRAMLAAAVQSVGTDIFQQKLKSAAIYAPDRTALYNLINYPDKLTSNRETANTVDNTEVVEEAPEEQDEVYEEITPIEDILSTFTQQQVVEPEQETLINKEEPVAGEESLPEVPADIVQLHTAEPDEVAIADFDESQLEDVIFAQYAWAKDADIEADDVPPTTIQQPASEEKKTANQPELSILATPAEPEKQQEGNKSPEKKNEFSFDIAGGESITESNGEATESKAAYTEPARLSKYDDDKLPYTFLWWLDKVRKEHAESHQPYLPFKPVTQEISTPAANVPEELQQQYYENIFHVTTVEELEKTTATTPALVENKRKEDDIIERFIQEDPQIKPPTGEKLDNENKARRSAEDSGELVSETLARIYLDQMLYHKAISTYQKLLLKFPEKSSYFVAQIKLLEKKIN